MASVVVWAVGEDSFPSFRLKGGLHARGLCASLYKYSGNTISTYWHHLHTLLMEAVCSANSSMLSAPLPKDVGTNGLVGHLMFNAWGADKEQLRRSTRKLESISPPTCRMNTTYFSHGLGGCLPRFIGIKGWACCNPFGWSCLGCARQTQEDQHRWEPSKAVSVPNECCFCANWMLPAHRGCLLLGRGGSILLLHALRLILTGKRPRKNSTPCLKPFERWGQSCQSGI